MPGVFRWASCMAGFPAECALEGVESWGCLFTQGWALPLCELSESSQVPHLAEEKAEVQRALALGTS